MLLLTFGVFLCGLQGAELSQRAYCTADRCSALFLKPADFSGAVKGCQDSGGRLGEFSLIPVEKTLDSAQRGITGIFWVNSAGAGTCASTEVTTGEKPTVAATPCSSKLDGFLCEYGVDSPCSGLSASEDQQVSYAMYAGFEVVDSDTFPTGTVATTEKLGVEYPDSRHVCLDGSWLKAPWSCEVLNGGCEHSCNKTNNTCTCTAGQHLHTNNITCTKDPCAECAQTCQKEGDSYLCACDVGYRLAQDGKNCVDVDECKEKNPCTGVGEKCFNTQGGHECKCLDNFELEDGVCVNVTICPFCEHMLCVKTNGVYGCQCRKGFRVSPADPTTCDQHCTKKDCPARCIRDPERKEDMLNCFCPEGYIRDSRDNETICTDIDECDVPSQCEHMCENTFGSFRCLCDEDYELYDGYKCRLKDPDEDTGSGSTASYPPPASAHPATVPFYIKTGSVMGITIFIMLCAGLVYFLGRNMAKRCGRFDLTSLKSPDIDIFYLQQVSTDTYKRLSFDKQCKNDSNGV